MTDLIQRLQDGESGNALDVLIEVALSPLNRRANSAGTKVIYTDETGESTHWAPDWSLKPDRAIAALRAKDEARQIAEGLSEAQKAFFLAREARLGDQPISEADWDNMPPLYFEAQPAEYDELGILMYPGKKIWLAGASARMTTPMQITFNFNATGLAVRNILGDTP